MCFSPDLPRWICAAVTAAALASPAQADSGVSVAKPAGQTAKRTVIKPDGEGIPGISPAIRVSNADLIFLSGHVPARPDGTIRKGGLEKQTEQVFRNIEQTLKAGGSDLSDVIRLTIYVRDLEPGQVKTIRKVRDRFIDPDQPPASALIGVTGLFDPDVLVEIDAIAISARK